ncbi:MAG: response regulator transcription factor [Lentisphaerae bacterium]|nr:response regulator transcription factor [Lentisphaerota bacterium]
MGAHVLLIEDNSAMATYVTGGLRAEGYAVDLATSAEEAICCINDSEYGLVICDVGLPGMSGFDLVEQLRKTDERTPILFLSAKSLVDDRVKGLQVGADDYLTKPFSFAELLARCEALMRRNRLEETSGTELRVADLRLDLVRQKAYRGSVEIFLQPLEFKLLHYMAHNKGQVLSKTEIMKKIWDLNFEPDTNIVEVRMHHLRTKVDKPFGIPLIHTERGVGYVLEERSALSEDKDASR